MKRILIVQSDADRARDLSTTITAQGEAEVVHASTVREACLLIAQSPFDVVLVDDREEEGARRALHALQPDLTLKALSLGDLAAENGARLEELFRLLFDEVEQEEPAEESAAATAAAETWVADSDEVTRVIQQTSALEETLVDAPPLPDLDETLVEAVPQPSPETVEQVTGTGDQGQLTRLLGQTVATDSVTGCVLTLGDALLEVGGALTTEQAEAIAQRIAETLPSPDAALLQYIQLGEPSVEFALFTRKALTSQYLTLVAVPDIDAGRLRRAAESLSAALVAASEAPPPQAPSRRPEAPPVATHAAAPHAVAPHSFAIIVQPRRPLPVALHDAVRDALRDVATRIGCELSHEKVTAELVHFVTSCPADRGSGWLAQRYKQGVEQRIQDQFGVPAQLWRKGFYAKEGQQPLSDVELNLFLHP